MLVEELPKLQIKDTVQLQTKGNSVILYFVNWYFKLLVEELPKLQIKDTVQLQTKGNSVILYFFLILFIYELHNNVLKIVSNLLRAKASCQFLTTFV